MRVLSRVLWNPIVAKELRSRMRTPRTAVLVTFFVTLVGLIGLAAYAAAGSGQDATASAHAGQAFFLAMCAIVFFLIFVLVPGLTAGAISGERERQTLDLLLCTRLRAGSIVVGKLLGSLLLVLLLLAVCVPLLSLVFVLGGVEAGQVLIALLAALLTTLLLGSLALLSSAVLRRSVAATVTAYGLALAICIGPYVLAPLLLAAFATGGTVMSPFGPASVGGGAPSTASAVLNTVTLVSPLTALTGSLTSTVSTGGRSCGSSVSPGPNGVPLTRTFCTSNPVVSTSANDTVHQGPFDGWHAWQATTLLDGLLIVLVLVDATVVVRGRLPRRMRGVAAPPAGVA